MDKHAFVIGAVLLAVVTLVLVWIARRASGRPRWFDWLFIWPVLMRGRKSLAPEEARRNSKRVRIGWLAVAALIVLAVLFTGGPKNPI